MSSKKSAIEKNMLKLIKEKQPIVLLHRLTEEEIKRYTSKHSLKIKLSRRLNKKRKKKINDRDKSSSNESLFNKYKKCRQDFLMKKNKKSSKYIIDTFDLNDFTDKKKSTKKRSMPKSFLDLPLECSPPHNAYSENDSFCSDTEPFPKKKVKKIIRRPIINSDSDYSLDDFENAQSFDKLKQSNKNISSSLVKPSKDHINSDDSDTILSKDLNSIKTDVTSKDSVSNIKKTTTNKSFDLVSKIMDEMDDYDSKNRKKRKDSKCVPSPLTTSENQISQINEKKILDQKKSKLKKSSSRKNKQIVDPDVLDTLNFILNGVCDNETRRLMREKGQKKCKWCETLFHAYTQKEIFCFICKDVFLKSKSLSKKQNKLNLASMKEKLLKKLPTIEKNRLLYKCNNKSLDKTYSHCKVTGFEKPKVNDNQDNSRVKRNISANMALYAKDSDDFISASDKEDSDDPSYNPKDLSFVPQIKSRKVFKTKPKTKANLNISNENNIQTTNNNSLFLMTFSESNKEPDLNNAIKQNYNALTSGKSKNLPQNPNKSEMKKPAQSPNKDSQYNTYSLSSMPTIVVANYATNDASNGDYFLSSVYYQSEMTQLQNPSIPLNNNINSLSSSSSNIINKQAAFNANLICQPLVSSSASLSVKIAPTMSLEKQSSNEIQTQVRHLNTENNLPNEQLNTNKHLEGMEDIPLEQMNLKKSSEMGMHNPVHTNDITEKKPNFKLQISSDPDTSSALKEKTHTQKNSESNKIQEQNSTSNKQNSLVNLQESNNVKMPRDVIVKEMKKILNPLAKLSNNESEAYTTLIYEEIEAISILGVLDLYGNLEEQLYSNLEKELNHYNIVNNLKENDAKKESLKLAIILKLKIFNTAKSLFEKFGSFEKVVENCIGKEKKKAQELNSPSLSQNENEKPKDKLVKAETRQSCQYSSISSPLLKETENINDASLCKVKTENLSSCMLNKTNSLSELETPINKLQTQINSITSSEKTTSKPSLSETSSYGSSVAALTNSQINIQNASFSDSGIASESRETPSRGSGSITPARPESAATQPEDNFLSLAQIKREKISESESLDKSSCAFSQSNTASVISNMAVTNSVDSTQPTSHLNSLSQLSSHVPDILTQIGQITPHTQQGAIAQNNNQILLPQNTDKCIPPNRTVPFSNANMSNVLFNLARNNVYRQENNVHLNSNNVQANNNYVYKRNSVINVQHVYIPTTSSLPSVQSPVVNQVPSTFPNNQYVQQPPLNINSFSNNTFVVNNNGIPNQNAYPGSNIVHNAQIPASSQFLNAPLNQQVINTVNSQSIVNVPNQQIVRAVPNQQVMPALANQQIMPAIANQQILPAIANQQMFNNTSTQPIVNTTANQQFVNTSSNHPILNQVSQGSTEAVQSKQSSPLNENEEMRCVVCNTIATLRCKQCAKVAFCNTECAKYYWHKKHKLECKMMATES